MNIKHYLEQPSDLFWRLMRPVCSDKMWIQHKYKSVFHKPINFKNPQTFNEKLNWLKLYNRNPLYTTLVDKYAVKSWVAERIGEEHIIPTLGVYNTFDEIDFSELPQQFVLKCTHDSGGLAIVTDKDAFLKDDEMSGQKGITSARKKISESLKRNFYYYGREWPYKNVKPRIIAEQYMVDNKFAQVLGKGLTDYKLMCFNGKARLLEIHRDRFSDNHTQDFYYCGEIKWEKTSISQSNGGTPPVEYEIEKPAFLADMILYSELLAKNIPVVRVDWYYSTQLYFGEMTFYDSSGFEPFDNPDDDMLLGSWIVLPEKK